MPNENMYPRALARKSPALSGTWEQIAADPATAHLAMRSGQHMREQLRWQRELAPTRPASPSPLERLAARIVNRASLTLARAAKARLATAPDSTKRTTGRAPRRPRAAPARRVHRADDDDGPAPPPQILADQRWAPAVGLSGRALVALLKRREIHYTRDGRRYVFRVADVLGALGLSDAPRSTTTTAPSDFGSPAYVERKLRLVAGGKRGAS